MTIIYVAQFRKLLYFFPREYKKNQGKKCFQLF